MANTNVTLTYVIDSAVVDDVIDTIAKSFGYVAGQQTKQQFIKQEVGVYLKTKYNQQKISDAEKEAQIDAAEAANAITIG